MDIIMLESLQRQLEEKKAISKEIRNNVREKIREIQQASTCESALQDFLRKKNGKKMAGTEHVWKFRLNGGDRILYTYAKYMQYLPGADAGDLVLIGYSDHDGQSFFARNHHLFTEKDYKAESIISVSEKNDDGIEKDPIESVDDPANILSVMNRISLEDLSAYIISDSFLENASEEDLEIMPFLSGKQTETVEVCCTENRPALIQGGAGTGKTLVAIHILNQFPVDKSNKAIYFTQSSELRSKAEELFKLIADTAKSEEILFKEINPFCLEHIAESDSTDIITFTRFENDVFSALSKQDKRDCEKSGIDSLMAWTEIRGVIKGLVKGDAQKEDIEKSEYLTLSGEDSILLENQRKVLWKVYERYREYLNKNGLCDDNDLARRMILKYPKDHFDLIVVDEVQDYTFVQLRLLKHISKRAVFVGDSNQNVNPTLFREKMLKDLYGTGSGTNITFKYLAENYRCPKQTIELANKLSKMRRQQIASRSQEAEVEETSRREGTKPFRLKCSEENLKTLLHEMQKYPRVAFLVPSEEEKNKALALLGTEQHASFIHTVAEIKGMEYTLVFCYNVFGKHYEIWKKIFAPDHKKKNTCERYYFNLAYVAMTRTRKHLGFIDEKVVEELEKELDLDDYDTFDAKAMHFDTLSRDAKDWIKDAEEYETNGLYEDAIGCYRKGGASIKNIWRCQSKQDYSQAKYEEAFKLAVIAECVEIIQKCIPHLKKGTDLWKLSSILSNENKIPAKENYNELIDTVYKGNSEEEISAARMAFAWHLDCWLTNFFKAHGIPTIDRGENIMDRERDIVEYFDRLQKMTDKAEEYLKKVEEEAERISAQSSETERRLNSKAAEIEAALQRKISEAENKLGEKLDLIKKKAEELSRQNVEKVKELKKDIDAIKIETEEMEKRSAILKKKEKTPEEALSPKSVSARRKASAKKEQQLTMKEFFEARGLTVEDKRKKGGNFWVSGEQKTLLKSIDDAAKTFGSNWHKKIEKSTGEIKYWIEFQEKSYRE